MTLTSAIFIMAVVALPGMAQSSVRGSSDAATEKELTSMTQQLLDAVAIGNKAVWEKYVADDAIYTDENWRILTKRQLIDSMAPLPKGYSGSIRVANVQSRIGDNAAVLSYRALEEETVFGQKLTPTYLITETWFKRDGRWQLVASHVAVLPSERKPIAVTPKSYRSIAGEYELTAGIRYVITLEGDKLIGQRTGRSKEELLPADENTYFAKGTTRGEKVFVRDAGDQVTHMLDRRENNDLVWKRVR
jgi:hypothetical protein